MLGLKLICVSKRGTWSNVCDRDKLTKTSDDFSFYFFINFWWMWYSNSTNHKARSSKCYSNLPNVSSRRCIKAGGFWICFRCYSDRRSSSANLPSSSVPLCENVVPCHHTFLTSIAPRQHIYELWIRTAICTMHWLNKLILDIHSRHEVWPLGFNPPI